MKILAGVVKTAFYVSRQTFSANKKFEKLAHSHNQVFNASQKVFFLKKTCEQSFMKSLFQEEQQILAENRLEN